MRRAVALNSEAMVLLSRITDAITSITAQRSATAQTCVDSPHFLVVMTRIASRCKPRSPCTPMWILYVFVICISCAFYASGSVTGAAIPRNGPVQVFVSTIRDARRHLVAAAVARSTSIFCMYPVDTIKVSNIISTDMSLRIITV
jgi:hypothetical protein